MTELYISLYRRTDGTFDSEAGISETYDKAMEWLSDYHYAFAKAGATYFETLVIGKAGGQEFVHHENLLEKVPAWERQQSAEYDRNVSAQELYPQ